MLTDNIYLKFIRFAIGSGSSVSDEYNDIDWESFYAFCVKQSVAGIVFKKIEEEKIQIHRDVVFEWYANAEFIKATNRNVDKKVCQISEFWEGKGYRTCILKGQANAMMYPKPEMRSPGDIDIWVDGDAQQLIKIAQEKVPEGHYSLHHVTMPVYNDVSIEVHYRPVFLDNWWLDRRLKEYTEKEKGRQFGNRIKLGDGTSEINGLTDDFNAVFQMLHMWHHLLSTRNNLKQLIDYYYLLKRGFTDAQRREIADKFKSFGVMKYARGIMWVERYALGLDEQYLLVEPDEKIGRLLLQETMNYGKRRVRRNRLKTLIRRVTNNLRLFAYFPSLVLIAPIYLIWHQWWKWDKNRKMK